MGDFNTTPFSPCYDIFTGHIDTPSVNADYFQNAFKAPFTGTYHGFNGITDKDPIDWILYRGNITSINSEVIQDTFKNIYISDHFPLCAQFALGAES